MELHGKDTPTTAKGASREALYRILKERGFESFRRLRGQSRVRLSGRDSFAVDLLIRQLCLPIQQVLKEFADAFTHAKLETGQSLTPACRQKIIEQTLQFARELTAWEFLEEIGCVDFTAKDARPILARQTKVLEADWRRLSEHVVDDRCILTPSKPRPRTPPFFPERSLENMMRKGSCSQQEAADFLKLKTARGVRKLVKNGKLNKTAIGRVVCDDKLRQEYERRHSPARK